MKNIEKFLEQVAEKTDINFNCVNKNGDYGYYIEFEYWSNLGEDVIISLVVNELTKDSILHSMFEYADNFDAEENAAMWFNMHGEHGAPTSLRDLLEDADEQQKKLDEIFDVMQEIIESEANNG